MVLVLYEDSLVRGTKPANYGPHVLLAQCVAERLNDATQRPDAYSGRQLIDRGLVGNPRRGNSKLRDDVAAIFDKLAGAARMVAVYDRDRIDDCVVLPGPSCTSAIVAALTPEGASPDRLRTVLLADNLETLIKTLQSCGLGESLPWDPALAKGRQALEARDRIMHNAATARREVRDCLIERMQSFDYLVTKVTDAVRAAPWLPP